MYYQSKRRTVGSKEPFQQNSLSWCQRGIVTVIHSALEPHISSFFHLSEERQAFHMLRHSTPDFYFCFLIYTIVCGWLVYFYLRALLLLITDIFLIFQSGQKVPETILFTFGAVSLSLLLPSLNVYGCSWPGNLVLEQNSRFFVFSLVVFFLFFWGGGVSTPLFWSLRPFYFTFVWLGRQGASSDYRANSGKASIPNCFNCKVSWKDSIHVKNARWWCAYCRTEVASAFVVTVRLQRAVYVFCLFPCLCAP